MARNFRQLLVWQRSMDLVKDIYSISSNLPKKEIFGLQSQIRRASVSISSNIAEGASRKSSKEFKRFIEIAIGSSFEVETHLLLINDIYSLKTSLIINEVNEIQRMLYGLYLKIPPT